MQDRMTRLPRPLESAQVPMQLDAANRHWNPALEIFSYSVVRVQLVSLAELINQLSDINTCNATSFGF